MAIMIDAHLLPYPWWKVLPYEKRSIIVTKRRVLLVRTNPLTNKPITVEQTRWRSEVRLIEERDVFAVFGGERGEVLRRVVLSVGGEEMHLHARDARQVVEELRYPRPGAP